MTANNVDLVFGNMSETELRQWVEFNPGLINDRDSSDRTPLCVAVSVLKSLSVTVWLLDEKGADVNATTAHGTSALHYAASLDILNALLDRDADPTLADRFGGLVLMYQAEAGPVQVVERLLQDPRVRPTINVQDKYGKTAFHDVCQEVEDVDIAARKAHLLQAGTNPTIINKYQKPPVAYLECYYRNPNYHALIALLEQYPDAQKDAEKASLLVTARRLVMAAARATPRLTCKAELCVDCLCRARRWRR
jgi:hypothetical protein